LDDPKINWLDANEAPVERALEMTRRHIGRSTEQALEVAR